MYRFSNTDIIMQDRLFNWQKIPYRFIIVLELGVLKIFENIKFFCSKNTKNLKNSIMAT